ncbi:MAG: fimbrillin family protein [Bacteroides sp.]|nr:fimbrillin family protein [Bacteroides sp.]
MTTTNDCKDMVDLVTDCRSDIQDQTATSNSGTVSFKFSHVLTKVADIKVKPGQDLGNDIKIFVTGLKLNPGSDKLQNKAKYQFSDNSWAALTPASYFSGDLDLTGFLNKATASSWGYTTSSVDVSDKDNATSLFSTGEALYFIPVDNWNGTGTKGDLKLKITYDVVTKVTDGSHTVSTTTEKEVDLPQSTFKKGTEHTYTLTIKLNTINITVDETIVAWTTATAENMDVEQ